MGIHDTILSLQPGDLLGGRYELTQILGSGGMGVVWLAYDQRLDGRAVAIKVLPAALSTDKRAVTRLKAEATRNLDLTHPHIVRLYTFDQDPARQEVAFLVMQYIEGKTLNDLLADHPEGLPFYQLRPWFEQIAGAIDFAHGKGILHRDIKPSNIIIEERTSTAYLMDFGIAREARDSMTRVTGLRDSSGTLPYMSPQQIRGKNEKSNDIYSFAATLYEALSGNPPFHTGDIAYQIREVEAEDIAHVSRSLNLKLRHGLAKESSGRPVSCQDLLHDHGTATPTPESRRLPSSVTSPRHLSRKTVELAKGVPADFVFIHPQEVAQDGFLMGSPTSEAGRNDDETQHRVKLTRGFWLQTTVVTQQQWKSVMRGNPSIFKNRKNYPVDSVSWDDCQQFIDRLRQHGIPARLPTESEWEFACRAGTTTPFSFGETISTQQANFRADSTDASGRREMYREKIARAGSFPPNAWGLYDMHGNVSEWCQDWYGAYPSGTVTDPTGPLVGSFRVLRGGSGNSKTRYLRSADRDWGSLASSYSDSGFRLALDSE